MRKHFKHRHLIALAAAGILLFWSLPWPAEPGDDSLVFSTYMGGNAADQASALALDQAGNAYVAGVTESTVFPLDHPPRAPEHGVDAWAGMLQQDGAAMGYLLWVNAAALFAEDQAYGIAVDGLGSAYVVGQTHSEDFCSYFGALPGFDTTHNGGADGFLFKVKPDGSGLDYCTFLGGSDWDVARAVAVDQAGNAYITGGTWSADFTTTEGAFQPGLADLRDAFVVAVDGAGTGLRYATFLGADGQDEGQAITVDPGGAAYVAGWTNSTDFVTTGGVVGAVHNGGFDAFVTSLDEPGSGLRYSTYLGAGGEDRATAIGLDASGGVFVAGFTASQDFPTSPGTLQATYGGGPSDGYLARLAPDAGALTFVTYLGGSDADRINGIDVDSEGRGYVAGETWSSDFPTTAQALQPALNGERDAFLAQVDGRHSRLLYSSYLGGSDWDQGRAIAVDGSGHALVAGGTRSVDFPTTPGAFNPANNGDYDGFVAKLRLTEPMGGPFRVLLPLLLRR